MSCFFRKCSIRSLRIKFDVFEKQLHHTVLQKSVFGNVRIFKK